MTHSQSKKRIDKSTTLLGQRSEWCPPSELGHCEGAGPAGVEIERDHDTAVYWDEVLYLPNGADMRESAGVGGLRGLRA
jgi:hypothetical protein